MFLVGGDSTILKIQVEIRAIYVYCDENTVIVELQSKQGLEKSRLVLIHHCLIDNDKVCFRNGMSGMLFWVKEFKNTGCFEILGIVEGETCTSFNSHCLCQGDYSKILVQLGKDILRKQVFNAILVIQDVSAVTVLLGFVD